MVRLRHTLTSVGPAAGVVIVLLVLWQGATALFTIPDYILPSPVKIAAQLIAVPTLGANVTATTLLTLTGFAAGALIGLSVAAVLHLVPLAKRGVYPLLVLSQNIPTIVLAPLLVLWLGFGILPKAFVITIYCFFPVTVAALDGLRSAEPTRMNYLLMIGARRWQRFVLLEVPSALPSVFSGLKVSAAYSVAGAVIAEWMGSDVGLGHFLLLQKAAFRVDRMFVAIIAIATIAIALFALVGLAERWVLRWRIVR